MKKVLFLHGFLQTGDHMRLKTCQLRKILKNCEFIYPDAPFAIKADEQRITAELISDQSVNYSITNTTSIASATGNRFGYYISEKNDSYACGFRLHGVEESIAFIMNQICQQRPDYIFAFSQSATLMIYVLQQQLLQPRIPTLLISPYFCESFDRLLKKQILDVINEGSEEMLFACILGKTDQIINQNQYNNLKQAFRNCKFIEHDGGHFVACGGELKQFYKEFVTQ